jgi:hypothetical protein
MNTDTYKIEQSLAAMHTLALHKLRTANMNEYMRILAILRAAESNPSPSILIGRITYAIEQLHKV